MGSISLWKDKLKGMSTLSDRTPLQEVQWVQPRKREFKDSKKF